MDFGMDITIQDIMHHFLSKKHAFKKYDQFTFNTFSFFWEVLDQILHQLYNFTKFLLLQKNYEYFNSLSKYLSKQKFTEIAKLSAVTQQKFHQIKIQKQL